MATLLAVVIGVSAVAFLGTFFVELCKEGRKTRSHTVHIVNIYDTSDRGIAQERAEAPDVPQMTIGIQAHSSQSHLHFA